ncbi:MAG: hypothetical protein IPK61_17425 [Saprospiraceae bacterium]|nr:hypothetical protein [Saprospiraceae bacterium]
MEAQELRIGVNRDTQGKGKGRIKLQADLKKAKWINYLKSSGARQIEGRANIDKYERVSKECIYQYVYEDKGKEVIYGVI